ncbi:hypothetical protein PACTADRAFT_51214 [Pachysolen tannophilus NRRL Y-2460]|uniref:D-isomer specific 2-hydroxyacid dehydrogenase NAD-binding domain-containing protein n=1 Tax=Pachysolen tannophilus NRRL Y-2460 TaxID=669874 RepID=A0A1E4TRH4_PACTA|nr:hypothetical protein PACTADRAFT_51214 [Pachysolen tannophilus NRRL Y-2460]
MSKPKVLQLPPVRFAQEKWQELADLGVEVITTDVNNRQDFLKELTSDKYNNLIGIARTFESVKITGRFDEELIEKLPSSVKVIAHNVDGPTADTNVFLILSCLRNFQESHDHLIAGEWLTKKCGGTPIGNDPTGKIVGIFGMGGIGRAVRDRLKPFGFKEIIYHNRKKLSPDLENGANYVSFEELLTKSDIISINIPLNPNTKHIINQQAIDKMKKGVIIVNTARGAVIDESILPKNIKSGKIKAFGSDVFENEPKISSDLINLPNVISLPHMGTHTFETMKAMEEFVVENIESYLNSGKVKAIVPEQSSLF